MSTGWKRGYQIRSYLRSSLWIIPVLAGVAERVFRAIVEVVESRIAWAGFELGVEGAKALANTVITLSLSFVVFTFGSLLVAIQVASGQYTPRIIATLLLRDNVIRYTVALFVFTLLFSVRAINHIEEAVPQLFLCVIGALGLVSLATFLFLIDYAARLLRPVSLVKRVGDAGLRVINSFYPEMAVNEPDAVAAPRNLGPADRTVLHRGGLSIVLAVHVTELVEAARKANGLIEFAPQVGDFVGADEPLFYLHGGAAAIDDALLRSSVIFGSERTMEQDPLFGIRILVDIAIKALSAAINDPTTAVLAIDQLHRVLRSAGRRNLRTDVIRDPSGTLRVILRTPDWDDFVHLAFVEIRTYGASNIQIARRLRAMIINLANTLPAVRHAALRQELNLLDRILERVYVFPEDLALAQIPDSQGLGGSTDATAPKWGG
ncbi:MAG: DUF2254 domain-containing protein [Verrucomicrobiales bacterium]